MVERQLTNIEGVTGLGKSPFSSHCNNKIIIIIIQAKLIKLSQIKYLNNTSACDGVCGLVLCYHSELAQMGGTLFLP